ncbi:hypothetical protein [Croceibacterium ferulae]|uniref:hypothetical protein n=1 Tax=Croceibacterium ferulae TaxID=1854641 RepID=UPI0012D7392C|nr:hypothetical protein [Croceibacterium ferulae]
MVEEPKLKPLNQRDVGCVHTLDAATLAAIMTVEPAPECEDAEARVGQPMA